ncbi:DUF4129 domain-containing protein [Natrarchaeobaculum sulfurireducens]|uniref:Flagellar hook-length control protein FliK n=1 Tax=Natrarchaeobaculum sulfurireducens TaxID=2044521 RepID=A0A346PLQ8_9EURY|nr:DUF4129 domain-containing protein [Natrarchaeobaculum sulfurireducens]AXR80453.1 Flagellar hook-length control protein FliK [Natrarchaeobaculum sulfurireducens]
MAARRPVGRRLLAAIAIGCAIAGLVLAASAFPMIGSDALESSSVESDTAETSSATETADTTDPAETGESTADESDPDGPNGDVDGDGTPSEPGPDDERQGDALADSATGAETLESADASAGEALVGGALGGLSALGGDDDTATAAATESAADDRDDRGIGGEFGDLLADEDTHERAGDGGASDTPPAADTDSERTGDGVPTGDEDGVDASGGEDATDDGALESTTDADEDGATGDAETDGDALDDGEMEATAGTGEDGEAMDSDATDAAAVESESDATGESLEDGDDTAETSDSESIDDGEAAETADDGDEVTASDPETDNGEAANVDGDTADPDGEATDADSGDETTDPDTNHEATDTDSDNETSTAAAGEDGSSITDSVPGLSDVVVAAAVVLGLLAVGYLLYTRTNPVAAVRSLLGRLVSVVLHVVVAISRALERGLAALARLESVRELPGLVRATLARVLANLRGRMQARRGLSGAEGAAGESASRDLESETPENVARERIRAAFETVVDRSGIYRRRVETLTPSDVAASAKRAGAPAEPVETITDSFRDVEYGQRNPDRYLERTTTAHERLQTAADPEKTVDVDGSEAQRE